MSLRRRNANVRKAAQRSDYYTDQPMTNVAVSRFQRDTNFAAPYMAARLIVNKPTGLYDKWKMEDMNRDDMTARGDNGRAREGKFGKSQATFSVDTEALAYKLSDATQQSSDVQVKPQVMVPKILSYKALLRLERKMALALMIGTAWYRVVTGAGADSGAFGTTTMNRKKFSDASTDPILALSAEIQGQGLLTGFEPTGMLFGRRAWLYLRNHAAVRATLTSGTTPVVRNKPASLEEMAALLELEWCGVSRAVYNTAGENLAATNQYIVPQDDALLFYRPRGSGTDAGVYNNEDPAACVRFIWQAGAGNPEGVRIRALRDEFAGGGSDHWEIDSFNAFGVVTPEMGTYFTGMV